MAAATTLSYRFPGAGRIVSARVDCDELLPHIADFYRSYRCGEADGGAGGGDVRLTSAGGAYRISVAGGDWEAETIGDAVLCYEYELTGALLRGADRFVHLHGAAVCRNERCLLLIGPSGAGKSTLTLGLHLAGWRALADDALLIDPGSGEVQPFDRSVRVHQSGTAALGADPSGVAGARLCAPYLWLRPPDTGRSPRRPTALVFLQGGEEPALQRLGRVEALQALLTARLSDRPPRDFECLAALAARIPAYRLRFNDFPGALVSLEGL